MKKTKNIFIVSMLIVASAWIILALLNIVIYKGGLIITLFMIADSVCFIILAFIFDKHILFKIATACFLFINTVLTVTDQMGVADYAVLILNLICIGAMVVYWKVSNK